MFAVLLLVLTLLSTFGGSISPKKEMFFVDEPAMPAKEKKEQEHDTPAPPASGPGPVPSLMPDMNLPGMPAAQPVPEPFTQDDEIKDQYAPF